MSIGTYVSSADTPYNQRSLPPSNLNDNSFYPGFPYSYHVYRVKKDMEVVGGPIAPVCIFSYHTSPLKNFPNNKTLISSTVVRSARSWHPVLHGKEQNHRVVDR